LVFFIGCSSKCCLSDNINPYILSLHESGLSRQDFWP
jgi:hypothetical protein